MAHEDANDSRMQTMLVRCILIGIPVAIAVLTLAVWLITDQDLPDAISTALLPGILLGVFAGGFTGVALTMD